MKKIALFIIISLSLILSFASCQKKQGILFIYCAAGMRDPVTASIKQFEAERKEEGRPIEVILSFDGSNKLLSQLGLLQQGDLYIAGDVDYIEMAAQRGYADKQASLCFFVPVILVQKGNPLAIKSLFDLTKPGIKLGMGDPKAAAVGRLTDKLLTKNEIDRDAWQANWVHSTPTVNELAMSVKLGSLDAAVIWDSIALNYQKDCDVVEIPFSENIIPQVGVCTLTFSEDKDEAEALMNFLIGAKGQAILKEHGYTVSLDQ